ncbi:transposase [Escherichia coli]|uniref:transposase n=1 Tax=Escherichia coli TaxID=562 RepID=UPI0037742548|nr:transposase [Escherichia coli]
MKSLTAVRKKSPNYPVEFKIKMVELSHRPEISVAQLAREHGINDNLLFKWRQYWREGKLRPPSTTENNVPELLPITLDAEDVVPTTSPRSQPVAAATPESLNISCEGHCCKVSDEAAFCLIQRPYISKTLLTRRISPRGSP